MTRPRTHVVTTTDGVSIRGAVHGQGPPLALLQGVIGDADLDWQPLLGHLTDRFTCHLPHWRGRGRSDDHPDLSFGRLVDDVLAYIDSLAEPAGLVGWSGGAGLALAAAAQSSAVATVTAIEPLTPRRMDEQQQAALGDAVARMGEVAAEGRATDGLRAFAGFLFNDREITVAEDTGYLQAAGRYVPQLLSFFQQQVAYRGTTHQEPAVLRAVSVPVLVLVGSDTKPYATAAAQHVADRLPNAQIREIPGAGHAAPLTHPEALAEALVAFLSPIEQP